MFLLSINGREMTKYMGSQTSHSKKRQIFIAENFCTNEDRRQKCIGGTSENSGISQSGSQHHRQSHKSCQNYAQRRANGKQWCYFPALESQRECEYCQQNFQQPVICINGISVKRCRNQIGSQTCISSLMEK